MTELVDALARDTGGRSFSHGMRELVDQAAERRDKLVAIVHDRRAAHRRADVPAGRARSRRIYNRDVSVHVEVDPSVLGGMRVQVGDEVIDGSVAAKLEALRAPAGRLTAARRSTRAGSSERSAQTTHRA